MITGVSGFAFFYWPFRDANPFFKNALLKPLFYSVFGCPFFGQVVKKENYGHPPKIYIFTDN